MSTQNEIAMVIQDYFVLNEAWWEVKQAVGRAARVPPALYEKRARSFADEMAECRQGTWYAKPDDEAFSQKILKLQTLLRDILAPIGPDGMNEDCLAEEAIVDDQIVSIAQTVMGMRKEKEKKRLFCISNKLNDFLDSAQKKQNEI